MSSYKEHFDFITKYHKSVYLQESKTRGMNKIKTATEVFDKCAKEYQERFMDVSLYHESFDVFCKAVAKENPAILELACGPGNITKYLLEKRPDFKILATDVAPNMVELGKANNPTAEFEVMDCRDMSHIDKKYDGIMCGFCLPYLSKEETIKLIHDASKLLQPEGVIYISTMEESETNKSGPKTSSSGEYTLFMHYHQVTYLIDALEENGFEVLEFKRQDYPTNDDSKVTDLIIIAKNQ